MKQVTITVNERKYKFIIELLKSFDFVTVQKEDTVKKQTLKHIATGIQTALLAADGKAKSRDAKAFLNGL
jgi:hypothetical protein